MAFPQQLVRPATFLNLCVLAGTLVLQANAPVLF
jgi:hypothetical protein